MNKNDNILKFYLLATSLKNKIRQGSIYWNVTAPRRESIAEHVYDTCILAIAIHSEYNVNVDISKVLKMLVIHELEEIINTLESGEIDLDDSINKYTEAMKLVKECDEELKEIEEKISKIALEDGNLEEFEVDTTK